MENVSRTVYGAYHQTCWAFNLPPVIKPFSTWNEKFNIEKDTHAANTKRHVIAYIGIGNGGHTVAQGPNGIGLVNAVQHRPTDASLYNTLPWIIRPVAEDLNPSERNKYRMRKEIIVNGETYVAYYLRAIDLSNTLPEMLYTRIISGQLTAEVFNPTISNLNPTPPIIANAGTNPTTSDTVSASAIIPLIMNDDDVEEFKRAVEYVMGDERLAMISEIAIVTGVDSIVRTSHLGRDLDYTEALDAQTFSFFNTFFNAQFENNVIEHQFDVGGAEPLIVV